MRIDVIASLIGLFMVMAISGSAFADQPECRGTKRLYKGKCLYPEEIAKKKAGRSKSRKSRAGKKPRSKPIERKVDFGTCQKGETSTCLANCKSGHGESCYLAGAHYQHGVGVGEDIGEAMKLFEKGCLLGFGASCYECGLGFSHGPGGVIQDSKKAARYMGLGCDNGDMDACATQGFFLVQGQGVRKNPGKGVKLLMKACDASNMAGCKYLGMCFMYGLGVEKDTDFGMLLLRNACSNNYQPACDAIERF